MPEKKLPTLEELAPAEAITAVINQWLATEISNSGENRNAYLDNWETFLKDGAAKVASHYDRLKLWTELFAKNSHNDEATALQLFAVCMGLSGAFRTQCFILATSPEDYRRRRYEGDPLGIDIGDGVNQRLLERFGGRLPTVDDLSRPTVQLDQLVDATNQTNELRLPTAEKIHGDPRAKVSMRKFINNNRLLELQKAWLDLGVDHILYAAQIRGGQLERVPFMEPKTITEAQIYYPFAEIGDS